MMRLALMLLLFASTAFAAPAGVVSESNLDFGTVDVGDSLDLSVTIRSTGDATLHGAILEGCDEFSIVSGGGAYSLAPGDLREVVVRFKPSANGTHGCVLTTSTCQCSNVTLSGEGAGDVDPVAVCDVSPASLDFGTLVPDSVVTQTFRIKNTGGSVLTGNVSETCANYSIVSGGGDYSLAAAESVNVLVRFLAPAVDGDYPCTVETGGAVLKALATCSDVSATATVRTPQAVCSITPSSLSFGTAVPDSAVDRSFVVKNTGDAGSTLFGSIAEVCADFSVTAGSGDFELADGESVTVTVRMQSATEGSKSCTIDTGATCADVAANGIVSTGGQLAAGNFTYDGAFKFGSTGSSLGYGAGRGLGILPNGNLVILGTDLTGYIVVATPATPIVTTNVGAMNQAATVSSFPDPTGGLWQTEGGNSRWEDIAVLDDRIAFTSYSFYDRAYDGRGGLGFLSLAFTNPTGMFWPGPADSVADAVSGGHKGTWYPGKLCGQMQQVPAAYVEGGRTLAMGRSRDEFGEDVAAGGSLYFVDPDSLENAVVALCYDQVGQSGENVPGPHSRPDYSLTDQLTDMAWIDDTVLFTESKCQYDSHYFDDDGSGGLADDAGVCVENKGYVCGEETDTPPGYLARFVLFSAADLVAVSHGEMDQWEPQPYATIEVTEHMLDADCSSGIAGAAWDETNRYLYVMQTRRNGDGPICHRWSVSAP